MVRQVILGKNNSACFSFSKREADHMRKKVQNEAYQWNGHLGIEGPADRSLDGAGRILPT